MRISDTHESRAVEAGKILTKKEVCENTAMKRRECSVLSKHAERFSPTVNMRSWRIAGGQVAHYPHHQQRGRMGEGGMARTFF